MKRRLQPEREGKRKRRKLAVEALRLQLCEEQGKCQRAKNEVKNAELTYQDEVQNAETKYQKALKEAREKKRRVEAREKRQQARVAELEKKVAAGLRTHAISSGDEFLLKPLPLPNDLLRHTLGFLDSDQRFELRVLSRACRQAYFQQRITVQYYKRNRFESRRCIRLALLGRRFPRVEVLDMSWESTAAEFRAIDEVKFPRLKSLYLRGDTQAEPADLKRLASVTMVQVFCDSRDRLNKLKFVSEATFPNLKVHSIRLDCLPLALPHSTLRKLSLYCPRASHKSLATHLDATSLREKYPCLEKIILRCAGAQVPSPGVSQLAQFAELGIAVMIRKRDRTN